MTIPKKWNAGVADEAWKVMICGRDYNDIDRTLSSLSYYLTTELADTKKGLELVRQMSGAQIIDALEEQKLVCLQTIKNGLKNGKEEKESS